ncbi:hypothetical protein ABT093_28995 [Kitasatospora sp. NPDC002551]|uniref:hypothetical protein n=1 Tax=Kitasatospora sp. NPDC002551 TaxID=3154539 RepID=UPI00332749B7
MPSPDVPALVDHHCHGVPTAELSDEAPAGLLTESDRPPAPGASPFDGALGLAVRRWCPPAPGLPAHAPAAECLARRRELGAPEAIRRLLAAAGPDTCLVAQAFPLGYTAPGLTTSHVGPRAAAVRGEMLEPVPFGKLPFSTDAYGLPGPYLVGAARFRHGPGALPDGWRADGACAAADAERPARRVAADNARRLYAL